jgi:ADP-ribose pyrophosphatase
VEEAAVSRGVHVQPWELLSSHRVLDEKWFRVRRDVVRVPSGAVLDDYFVWDSPRIVTVAPFTADGRFVLCQQYRHAIGLVTYQFPAGMADGDEPAEEAARRELEEESGFVGGSLRHLLRVTPFGTKMTELEDIFLAEGVTPDGAAADDDVEQTRVVLVTPAELVDLVLANEIHGATSALAAFLALKHLGLGQVLLD